MNLNVCICVSECQRDAFFFFNYLWSTIDGCLTIFFRRTYLEVALLVFVHKHLLPSRHHPRTIIKLRHILPSLYAFI